MIPETVKVGPFIYTVSCDLIVRDENDEQKIWGRCDKRSHEINIQKNLSPARRYSTLIHELIHAIEDVWVLDLDEDEVEKLEYGLLTLIADNPGLLAAIPTEEPDADA